MQLRQKSGGLVSWTTRSHCTLYGNNKTIDEIKIHVKLLLLWPWVTQTEISITTRSVLRCAAGVDFDLTRTDADVQYSPSFT